MRNWEHSLGEKVQKSAELRNFSAKKLLFNNIFLGASLPFALLTIPPLFSRLRRHCTCMWKIMCVVKDVDLRGDAYVHIISQWWWWWWCQAYRWLFSCVSLFRHTDSWCSTWKTAIFSTSSKRNCFNRHIFNGCCKTQTYCLPCWCACWFGWKAITSILYWYVIRFLFKI